jgi:uncharacterized membrane protein
MSKFAFKVLLKIVMLNFQSQKLHDKKQFLLFCTFLLIFCQTAFSATLYGTIYNMNLEKLDNAVVGITTEPRQTLVAKNGTYAFEVQPGEYTIIAFRSNGENLEITQTITIKDEGEYVLDLILFPTIRDEEDLLNITQYDFGQNYFEAKDYTVYLFIGVVVILSFIIILFIILKKSKHEEKEEAKAEISAESVAKKEEKPAEKLAIKVNKDDAEKILDYLSQQGGRLTQKDIRKQFPSSEAKISLIIAELESKGIIEKIKKGRGNIIKLKP